MQKYKILSDLETYINNSINYNYNKLSELINMKSNIEFHINFRINTSNKLSNIKNEQKNNNDIYIRQNKTFIEFSSINENYYCPKRTQSCPHILL